MQQNFKIRDLVTVGTYAKIVGKSRQHIYSLIKAKKLSTITIDEIVFIIQPKNWKPWNDTHILP